MKKIEKGSSWALVTGASGGIGYCYVKQLAERGYNIIAVARPNDGVQEVKVRVEAEYGVEVFAIEQDLAKTESAELIYSAVSEAGIAVEVLINNAGVFSYLDVLDTPVKRLETILLLHSYTLTMLCRLFGEDMRKAKKGYILNMSSFSHWIAFPGLALYTATKSYIYKFSRALAKELREDKVVVTVLSPAGVLTDLYGLPKNLQKVGKNLGILITPKFCVKRGLKAMFRGKCSVVPDWWNRAFLPIASHLPNFIVRMTRYYTKGLQK